MQGKTIEQNYMQQVNTFLKIFVQAKKEKSSNMKEDRKIPLKTKIHFPSPQLTFLRLVIYIEKPCITCKITFILSPRFRLCIYIIALFHYDVTSKQIYCLNAMNHL